MFKKNDEAKIRLELIDPAFVNGIGSVLTFGAEKYDAYNWQKADEAGIERIKGALLRHQMAYMSGERIDPETGLSHLYHIGCNAMFLDYFDRNRGLHPKQGVLAFDDGLQGHSIKAKDIK